MEQVPFLIFLGVIIGGIILGRLLWFGGHLFTAFLLGTRAKPVMQKPKNIKLRILIAGDSFMLGTGSRDINNSVPGRIARDFPDTYILNLSGNALSARQVLKKMNALDKNEQFDFAIIGVGAVDVMKFKNLKKSAERIRHIIEIAENTHKAHVLFIPLIRVEKIPIFSLYPFKAIYRWRSQKLHTYLTAVLKEKKIPLLERYAICIEGSVFNNPKNLCAIDKIHPNDKGYGILYECIREVLRSQMTGRKR